MEDPFEKYKQLAKYKEGETTRETELRIALITVQTYYEKEERNQKQLMDRALDHYSDDYQKLKRDNEALREEIDQLRQQQPPKEGTNQIRQQQPTKKAEMINLSICPRCGGKLVLVDGWAEYGDRKVEIQALGCYSCGYVDEENL